MVSSLGKRKVRDAEHSLDSTTHESTSTTVFVANLPYTATATDLQTLFSDIAPVRSAFVVTEPGTGISKGVGYVAFATRGDAQLAVDQSGDKKSSEMGLLEMAGRKLRVQWAESKRKTKLKHIDEQEDDEKGKKLDTQTQLKAKPKSNLRPCTKLPTDPLAIRTVVISGLPADLVDEKVLWKKMRKYTGAEKVDWPLGGEDRSKAHVLFNTPAAAFDAVSKLHAHVFKGALLSAALKRRLDTLARPPRETKAKKPPVLGSASTGGADDRGKVENRESAVAPSRASRLIVRNLPFDATEQDLRAVFLPYGPIWSVHVPTAEDANADEEVAEGNDTRDEEKKKSHAREKEERRGRGRGFAFVWMLSKKDAERAIEGCNGAVVRPGSAECMIKDKQRRKKEIRVAQKLLAKAGGGVDKESGDGVEEIKKRERVIAVDWALSKERWTEEKRRFEEGEDNGEEHEVVDSSESRIAPDEEASDLASGAGSESGDEVNLGVRSNKDDGDQTSGEGSGSDRDEVEEDADDDGRVNEEEGKPALPPPEAGTTLFVRNVPFDATEEELRTLFRSFGPLRYARITVDSESGRSRGTGFVCFWNVADADRVVQESEIIRAETVGDVSSTTKPLERKMRHNPTSILAPDPSSAFAAPLVLHGRALGVVRAVTRDEAAELRDAHVRERRKADRRGLYLLQEGGGGDPTPTELNRRAERRTLLRTNPGLHVSRTRLSVRRLPRSVTERMLRRLATFAVHAFEREVKEGTREQLSVDELSVDGIGDAIDRLSVVRKEGKGKGKGTKTSLVRQAKIVRDPARADPLLGGGTGRSRGYGFLEFRQHADALRVLRWADGNLEVGRLWSTWWKEEVKELMTRLERRDEGKEKGKGKVGEVDGEVVERLERLKKELKEIEDGDGSGKGKRREGHGTVIMEFAIENAQVVRRRRELQVKARSGMRERERENMNVFDQKGKKDEDKKRKKLGEKADWKGRMVKRRRECDSSGKVEKESNATRIGSIIGRKRKERKMGKK